MHVGGRGYPGVAHAGAAGVGGDAQEGHGRSHAGLRAVLGHNDHSPGGNGHQGQAG